ncbi:MAG: iron-sulfur cluster assembly scaffold protein [Desulfobacterales bacterium]|jgi:nitrogen fixation NifU-like protein|nr:iron-sulfur cluster assembly scaffold protein [Desulfobacterales bacterium]MDD3081464.1 iron-sulfur cluster assembly scaffold protein [Desulfobacterales bacterium]MDD3950379.1 iron-sulfur cluster assembly scaffold protein [Desulfobacterales bacterium]MDD4463022.1 iron-sulfur cluster assembly scaffold protein [Desulfobacterales bacterium]MDY0378219.1 iron-sulfur cluster assembly scaffold protein [Desulfobacterales bacterium]
MGYDLVIDFEGTKRYEKILSALGYSDKAIRYYIDKPFMGRLPDPDLTYEYSGNCGDHLILDLKLDGNRIADARFEVDGCPGSVCSAMALADIIRGMSLEEARKLEVESLQLYVEGLPETKVHCLRLAVSTLHELIDATKKTTAETH